MDRTLCPLLYPWKGVEDEEEKSKADPLTQPQKLGRQLATFTKMCKKVTKHTVEEDQEWRLGTSCVMLNRLREAGIDNRQAAIRGMPEVSQEDGEKVMTILMALRA